MDRSTDEVLHQLRFGADGRADPYPFYRRLVEAGPLHRSGKDAMWCAVRYGACRRVLLDQRFGHLDDDLQKYANASSKVRRKLERRLELHRRLGLSTFRVNPPQHTRLRNIVRASLAPARVDGMRERINMLIDRCLDRMESLGEADVMADLALPLAVGVIADIVGLPAELREGLQRSFGGGGDLDYGPDPTDEDLDRAEGLLDEWYAILGQALAERRAHPRDDLLSHLVSTHDDTGRPCGDDEVASLVLFTVLAGFKTVTDLVGNGLLALLRHPDQLARLWADENLAASAVEEMLRWDSPIQWVERDVLEPVEVEGIELQPHDTVLVMLGAANRDPRRFPRPERFDVARTDNAHLAFGWGTHFCVGAALARLEGPLVFGRLRKRFAIELLDETPPLAQGPQNLRGLRSLPVRVIPART